MKEIKGLNSIKESFRTRQVRYGGYATLITLAFVTGLLLVNLLAGRLPLRLDMTKDRLFSLSDQSVQIVGQIKSPVTMYGLWEPGRESTEITEILDLYTARNKNIRYWTVDPDRNPGLLARFDRDGQGIDRGSVIVEGTRGFRVILPYEMYDINTMYDRPAITGITVEHRITSALMYVETGETPVIYEIVGHGEDTLANLYLSEIVERENYSLQPLNLIQSDIPGDASALIINVPRTAFSRPEADKVLDYLDRGGRLLVLADYRSEDISMLNEILASYGIRFDYGVIMENNPIFSLGNVYLSLSDMKDHVITQPLHDKQSPVIMPYGMGISETGVKRQSVHIAPLLASSREAWLRSEIETGTSSMILSDKIGPIVTAVAVLDPQNAREGEQQTRIMAIGSGTILQTIPNFGQIPANMDFFMNGLAWLEDRPDTLSVRSKNVLLMPLMMNGLQAAIYTIVFVVLIPLAFFISGLVIWLKRRHL